MNHKFGKLPPLHLPTHVALSDHLDRSTTWPPVPPHGWEFLVPASEVSMLGNGPAPDNPPQIPDGVGDCATAGIYGLIQQISCSTNPEDPIVPTTMQALNLYSAVTGFNLNDPSTDQGTVLTRLLDYVKLNGLEVTRRSGKTETIQIVGWASADVSSFALKRWSAYTFGGRYVGINCPTRCEEDTANWNFAPGLPIAGGHCIVQAGEGSAGGKMRSWKLYIPTSAGFMGAYEDEGYIIVTPEWVNRQNESPTGLDLNGLLAAMKGL